MAPNPNFTGFFEHRPERPWQTQLFQICSHHMPGMMFVFAALIQTVTIWGPVGSMPDWPVMLLYHWTVYQPMPVAYLLVAGIIQDALLGVSFGVHTLMYVALYHSTLYQRRYILGQNFGKIWLAFCPVMVMAGTLKYILFSLDGSPFIDVISWVLAILATIACYPWVVRIFLLPLHRFLMRT